MAPPAKSAHRENYSPIIFETTHLVHTVRICPSSLLDFMHHTGPKGRPKQSGPHHGHTTSNTTCVNSTFALDGHATSQRNDAAVPVCSCIALLFLRLAEGGRRVLLFTNECDSNKHATKQSLRSSAPQSPLEDGEGKGLGSCGSLRSTRRAARVSGLTAPRRMYICEGTSLRTAP